TLHFQLPLELAFVESTLEEKAPAASNAASPAPAAPMASRAQRGTSAGAPAANPATRPASAATAETPRGSARGGETGAPAAEPRPPPVPTPPAPGAVADVSATDVRAEWSNVKRSIRSVNRRLEAFLNDVRPARVEGNKLFLEARFGAHQQQVMQMANR